MPGFCTQDWARVSRNHYSSPFSLLDEDKSLWGGSVYCCVLICFLWSVFYDVLTSWNLVDRGGTAPPRVKLISRDSKQLAYKQAFLMPINQSRGHMPNHLLYLTFILQEAIFLCANDPRTRYWTTRNHPIAQNSLKLFKLSSPMPDKLLILPRSFLPTKP